jgi:hypothetical protein
MTFTVPGFPDEISVEVELPDFAELLAYPMFLRASPDTVRSHGSAWQRRLLDLTPFRHDTPHQTVSTGVHIQSPGYRTLVGPSGAHDRPHMGWHIDGPGDDDHLTGRERVFLLESPCTSLTQFNESPVAVDLDREVVEDRSALTRYLIQHAAALGIRGRAIPPARIVTFTTHLHRPVVPRRLEFRFFWRARESHLDAPYAASESIRTQINAWSMADRGYVRQMERQERGLTIFFPDVSRGSALESSRFDDMC